MIVSKDKHLFNTDDDDDDGDDIPYGENDPNGSEDSDGSIGAKVDEIWKNARLRNIDWGSFMASAVTATCCKDFDAEHLSRIWSIDLNSAKRMLDVTSHHRQHTINPMLTRNFPQTTEC